MEKIDSQTGSASSCDTVVEFDFKGMFNRPETGTDKQHGKLTSKYKGVFPKYRSAKWKAISYIGGSNAHIAYYDNEIDAARAHDRFIIDNDLRLKSGRLRTTNYDLYGEYWK